MSLNSEQIPIESLEYAQKLAATWAVVQSDYEHPCWDYLWQETRAYYVAYNFEGAFGETRDNLSETEQDSRDDEYEYVYDFARAISSTAEVDLFLLYGISDDAVTRAVMLGLRTAYELMRNIDKQVAE